MNYTPQRIIYNGRVTIVFWADGSKTVVKCAEGTTPDKYNGFCAALAKKVYGTNTHLKKCIERAENAKRYEKELKKVTARYERLYKRLNELKAGDRVRVLQGKSKPKLSWLDCHQAQVGNVLLVEGINSNGYCLLSDGRYYDKEWLEKVCYF